MDNRPAKKERLDKTRILQLLAAADTKWFNSHTGQFNYREHLEYIAEYLVKNYNRLSDIHLQKSKGASK